MCVLIPKISKSYDEIADELARWVKGKENESLDKWLNSEGNGGIIKEQNNMYRKDRNLGKFERLQIPMQKKYVTRLAEKYGLDLTNIIVKIQRSESLLNLPFYGSTDYNNIGRIDLFPAAFADEETLIKTLIHESCHVKQLRKCGKIYTQDNLQHMEKQAYRLENILYSVLRKKMNI